MIPIVVILFSRIRIHYRSVSRQLTMRGLPPSLRPVPESRVVIPISGVHRGIVEAVRFACSISSHVTAVYIELEPGCGKRVAAEWQAWWPDIPLDVVPSPYRSMVGPLLDYLDQIDIQHNDGQAAVLILPEFIPAHWWQSFLHNQSAWLIRAALLYRRRKVGYQRVIIDIPYHLRN
jgi:hypothetical protein